jgi:lactate dehydrogenase-like 2-hydroxyacid dehydrogenase
MAGRVVVTGRVPEPALEILREAGELDAHTQETALPVADLHAAIAGAEAVVTLLHDRVDEAFLEAAGSQLRVVANVAVGYNNIDVAACSPTPRPTSRWRSS